MRVVQWVRASCHGPERGLSPPTREKVLSLESSLWADICGVWFLDLVCETACGLDGASDVTQREAGGRFGTVSERRATPHAR